MVRYEAEVSTAAIARTEADMDERDENGYSKTTRTLQLPARKRESASVVIKTLKKIVRIPDEKSIDRESAVTTLWALSLRAPRQSRRSLSVPGIPDEDAEFDAFDSVDGWPTRKATEVYAAGARMTVEALLYKCISSAYRNCIEADEEERDLVERARRWNSLLDRENCSRTLLEPET